MSMRTRWGLLGVCLIVACGASDRAGRSEQPPPAPAEAPPLDVEAVPPAVERALATAAVERSRAPSSCRDSCCPSLRWASAYWQGDLAKSPALRAPLRAALRQVISRTDPVKRALAIEWLGQIGQIEDVPAIEPHLSSPASAWPAPQIVYGQMAMACYTISGWGTATVGPIALAALSRLLDRRFENTAAYRTWRQQNADLWGALAHWSKRAWEAKPGECRQLVAELGARDVPLLLRLCAQRHSPDPKQPQAECPSIDDVVPIVRQRYGKARLLVHLGDPRSWRPDRDERFTNTDWKHLAIWALDHARSLFDPSDAGALAALLDVPAVQSEAAVAGRVAVAVATLAPERAAAVLQRAAPLMAEPPRSFAQAYAKRFPQDDRIQRWLRSHEHEPYALLTCGTVAGLGEAGPDGLKVLQRFVHDPGFEKAGTWVLGAVIDVASRRGAKLQCQGDLSFVCHKMDRGSCEQKTRSADANRRRCLASIRRWLAATQR